MAALLPSLALLLLFGAPRRWYDPGKRIAVDNAHTHAGKICFAVETSCDLDRINADITMPDKTECPGIKIRLRHPEGRTMRSATVNGEPITTFDPADELVEVLTPRGRVRIEASY